MKKSTRLRKELLSTARKAGVPFEVTARLISLSISLFLAVGEEREEERAKRQRK